MRDIRLVVKKVILRWFGPVWRKADNDWIKCCIMMVVEGRKEGRNQGSDQSVPECAQNCVPGLQEIVSERSWALIEWWAPITCQRPPMEFLGPYITYSSWAPKSTRYPLNQGDVQRRRGWMVSREFEKLHSLGENEEGKLKGNLANPGLSGRLPLKPVCAYVYMPLNTSAIFTRWQHWAVSICVSAVMLCRYSQVGIKLT